MGRVDIQVKMMRMEHDRQSVAFKLHYGRHEADSSHGCHATTWWRTYWKDSEPHKTHAAKMHRPFRKEMADDILRRHRTKRRVGFDIKDVGSDASGSKSKKGDDPMIGYEDMQTRIAKRKTEQEKRSNKKRVENSWSKMQTRRKLVSLLASLQEL